MSVLYTNRNKTTYVVTNSSHGEKKKRWEVRKVRKLNKSIQKSDRAVVTSADPIYDRYIVTRYEVNQNNVNHYRLTQYELTQYKVTQYKVNQYRLTQYDLTV